MNEPFQHNYISEPWINLAKGTNLELSGCYYKSPNKRTTGFGVSGNQFENITISLHNKNGPINPYSTVVFYFYIIQMFK